MYVSYLLSTRIDEGSIITMVGLDILLMNMTSFALNIWTRFSSQDKNGQSFKNLPELHEEETHLNSNCFTYGM